MGEETGIGWTHHTFNGWRGCVEVSPACAYCYAREWALRNLRIFGTWGKEGIGKRVVAAEAYWSQAAKWDRAAKSAGERRRVFSASMADVFEHWDGPMTDTTGRPLWVADVEPGRWLPWPAGGLGGMLPIERRNVEQGVYRPLTMDDVRRRLWRTIDETRSLDWLLLTKRIEDVESMVPASWIGVCTRCRGDRIYQPPGSEETYRCPECLGNGTLPTRWPSNVWLGTTVEDRKHGLPRIDVLREIPAAVRFLSVEPLLEDLGEVDLTGIHWAIVGGESGGKARPFDIGWARSLMRQCREQEIRFFFKQAGRVCLVPEPIGETDRQKDMDIDRECRLWPLGTRFGNRTDDPRWNGRQVLLRDKHGADLAELPEDLRVQEFPVPVEAA